MINAPLKIIILEIGGVSSSDMARAFPRGTCTVKTLCDSNFLYALLNVLIIMHAPAHGGVFSYICPKSFKKMFLDRQWNSLKRGGTTLYEPNNVIKRMRFTH